MRGIQVNYKACFHYTISGVYTDYTDLKQPFRGKGWKTAKIAGKRPNGKKTSFFTQL